FSAFFGGGGGGIAVPLIMMMQHSMHRAVGNSSGLMVISALTGTASYMIHGWGVPQLPPFSIGYVNLLVTVLVAPFTIVMARVGVRIANRTSHARLVRVFAVLIILVGMRMAASAFWP
ncbi:MAG: sulfite exporter TauE/SafE family protein, partial [Desulfuromonas sp.]|nr:sulfite exporter TauE/SafE family protein [Desulfuromonas sp.]